MTLFGKRRLLVLAILAVVFLGALLVGAYFLFLSPRNTSPVIRANTTGPNDWPAFMYDGARTGFNANETRLSPANAKDLKLLWKQKIGDGDILAAQPIVFSDTIYMGSWDGNLYALKTADGSTRWKKDLGRTTTKMCVPDTAGLSSAPYVDKDALYIGGGDDKFYALNPNNGDILWSYKTGDNSEAGGLYNWASPYFYNGRIYFGIASFCDRPFVNGRMWGFNARTGSVEQEVRFVPDDQKGGGIWTSPTVDEATGAWFVTTGSGDFYIPHSYSMARLDPTTLEVVDAWQIPIAVQVFDGDWGTTPTLFHDRDGKLMVGAAAKNGYFYAFDANNIHVGPAWAVQIADGGSCPQCGEGAISTSAYAYNTVYVAAGYFSLGQTDKVPGTVTALDPTTGAIKWLHPASGWVIPALAVANGLVFAAAEDTIEVIDAATGQTLWEYATEGALYAAPTVAGGVLYVASTDGYLYAFSAGPYPDNTTAYAVPKIGSNPPGFTPFRVPIPVPPPATTGEQQCFEATGKCISGQFLEYWRANGGLDHFGPAITGELYEAGRKVQYFRNSYLQTFVQREGGAIGVRPGPLDFRLSYPTPSDEHFDHKDPISGTTYVPETGHNLSDPILTFWRTNGEVLVLGYPVSELFTQYNPVDGQTRLVQYFERSRLEIVTDANGAEHVELGALGLQQYVRRYGTRP